MSDRCLFQLGRKSVKSIHEEIDRFLNGRKKVFHIHVSKHEFRRDELFFLEPILLEILDRHKDVLVTGLPYCSLHYLFGVFRLRKYIYSNLDAFIAYNNDDLLNSWHLPNCMFCALRENCQGLPSSSEVVSNYPILVDVKLKSARQIIFHDKQLQHKHNETLKHIESSENMLTCRYIDYAKVFDEKKRPAYDERFIYFCRDLSDDQLEREKSFIQSLTNSGFAEIIFDTYFHNGLIRSYTCSFEAGERTRENFYVYFDNNQAAQAILKAANIKVDFEQFEKPYCFGIDFVSGKPCGFKVYSIVTNSDSFFDFLQDRRGLTISGDIIDNSYNYLFVRRFDENLLPISVKIEFNSDDHKAIESLISREYHIKIQAADSRLKPKICAIDFNHMNIANKVTVYYSSSAS